MLQVTFVASALLLQHDTPIAPLWPSSGRGITSEWNGGEDVRPAVRTPHRPLPSSDTFTRYAEITIVFLRITLALRQASPRFHFALSYCRHCALLSGIAMPSWTSSCSWRRSLSLTESEGKIAGVMYMNAERMRVSRARSATAVPALSTTA
ncbi:hypothetical protein C8F01DRAFT_1193595 [Mycena amicta]|nr:hypothetical protein C8F01DRAFT_1193595 [Mycena amicta]